MFGVEAEDHVDSDGAADLVIIALSGVQRFISESRSTGDLGAASMIVARLSQAAAMACNDAGGQVVFPATTTTSEAAAVPNRVVALTRPDSGRDVVRAAALAVQSLWEAWVCQVFGHSVATPGFPSVQWVCIPAAFGSYHRRWIEAQKVLRARRLVRDFAQPGGGSGHKGRLLCSLSPRWPAEAPPGNLLPHQRDVLAAANWVKRLWRASTPEGRTAPGFPSTSSIASAPFRAAVLARMTEDADVRAAVYRVRAAVRDLVPQDELKARETPVTGLPAVNGDNEAAWLRQSGGRWVFPETWVAPALQREYRRETDRAAAAAALRGRAAARELVNLMADRHGEGPPAPYLAVIAQDLDSMGRFLAGEAEAADGETTVTGDGGTGELTAGAHQHVSEQLRHVAEQQVRRLSDGPDLMGVPIYAGGDDLLAFAPAATALDAARQARLLVPGSLPTASTAVVFFHHASSLRRAVAEAHAMLNSAKQALPLGASYPPKDALAVGYLRRSGARERVVLPWFPRGPEEEPATHALRAFQPHTSGERRHSLSPRLTTELERDAEALAFELPDELFTAELARLVERHGGNREHAEKLRLLGARQYYPTDAQMTGVVPVAASRVAVFLRQECR